MASLHEEQVGSDDSSRLTFRQKFWLLGVGIPVFLLVVFVAVAVFLPRRLSPAEQKLLGRWEEVVLPGSSRGSLLEFHRDDVLSGTLRRHMPFYWEAEGASLTLTDSEYRYRLRSMLGWQTGGITYDINRLTDNELHLRHPHTGQVLEYRRSDSSDP